MNSNSHYRNTLHRMIDRHAGADHALQTLSDRLAPVMNTKSLALYLRELLDDDAALQTAAQRSYLHGNGFYKIVLHHGASARLRLHIWEQGNSCEENIHDHRWPFVSAILAGQLRVDYFATATGEESDLIRIRRYHYTAAHDASAAALDDCGDEYLVLTAQRQHQAGTRYSMSPGEKHRICQHQGYAATVICTLTTANLHNNLYSNRQPSAISLGEQRLDVATLVRVIQRFLSETAAT